MPHCTVAWRFLVARSTRLVALSLAGAACHRDAVGPQPAQVPARLGIVVQPSSAEAGAAIGPAVTVSLLDSAGIRTRAHVGVLLRIAAGTGKAGAHLRGVTALAADTGTVAFTGLNIDSAGTGYRLVASVAGLPDTISAPFDIVPAPAAALRFVGQPSPAVTNAILAPHVRVAIVDSLGNMVTTSSKNVSLTLVQNTATLGGTLAQAATQGVADFGDLSVTASSPAFTLGASASGLPAAQSAPFDVYRRVQSVAVRYEVTCALDAGGVAWCWGNWPNGGLGGLPGSATSTYPVRVAGNLTFTSLDAGLYSACGLTPAGAAYCWGYGYGATPGLVAGAPTLASISMGVTQACGLTAAGAAWCWGSNSHGERGDGTRTGSNTAGPVAGGLTFKAISAGEAHTCALTAAGTAYCWGLNNNTQLGITGAADTTLPVAVGGGLTFATLSAGADMTCALTAAGQPYCWGFVATMLGGAPQSSATPVMVGGPLSLIAISVRANSHACGVTAAGVAKCWGASTLGALDDGPVHLFTWMAQPVSPAGSTVWSAVAAGSQYSCGVSTGAMAWCWGSNYPGLLGDSTTLERDTPVRVRIF